MYVNDRDQINYHSFLTALRNIRGYRLKQVSTGVCCESGMNRFEKGNRIPEKLVRDRLTARLGISCEKYEDYLQQKEYAKWELRTSIIRAIENRDSKTAKEELEKYEDLQGLNRVNQQFVEAMRFMVLVMEGVAKQELYACIKKAVQLTVPNIEKAFEGEYILADQEVNLVLEQMYLEPPKNVIRDEKKWRISEYEKLIAYVENSCWEKIQKAKIYPKIVHYICREILSRESTESEIWRGIELCNNAIELLRDNNRLYYFIELTEDRRQLINQLFTIYSPKEEKTGLEELLLENNQWEKLFKELYEEYKVEPHMSNFCYLYYENECHNVVEVIETRRKMLGLSRSNLAEGICTERTIVRLEREGVNPTIELVRRLIGKLGMCAEYRRARVITTDVNTLMLAIGISREINDRDFEKAGELLRQLKKELDLGLLHNKQQILRTETLIEYRQQRIRKEELAERTKIALEYTLPIKSMMYKGKKFFSRNELLCVFDLAFKSRGELSKECLDMIKVFVYEMLETGVSVGNIVKYELITGEYASHLGNMGDFEDSSNISERMIVESLAHRRMGTLADHIYNIAWNNQCMEKTEFDEKQYYRCLQQCLVISLFLKRKSRVAFFQEKLNP